jgi:hypothetical protein
MICLFYSIHSPPLFLVADQAVIKHELTPLFESFRVALDEVSARGDTAVYDALDVARSSLTQFRQDIPNLRRRIIIVSDGDDTSSKNMPTNVCAALQRDGIIVDSVQVGSSHNRILHAISVATGMFYPCIMSLAKVTLRWLSILSQNFTWRCVKHICVFSRFSSSLLPELYILYRISKLCSSLESVPQNLRRAESLLLGNYNNMAIHLFIQSML